MTPINHNICLFVLNNAVKEAGKKGKIQVPEDSVSTATD